MNALSVNNLTKRYPLFTLDRVSFCVGQGRVTGLIGANGAGKTTTLKAVMGLIKSEGEIKTFGLDFNENEREVKEKIGYIGGGFRYYPQHTVDRIARAVSSCYTGWRQETFLRYLKKYALDGSKKVVQLSDGMKVKLYLALALSHGARLLILDEPTSGLDPLSREEFCDAILSLVQEESVSVLFSTHVTSDLERIADDIVLLSGGKVLAAEQLSALKNKYYLASFESEAHALQANAIGVRHVKEGWEGLTTHEIAGVNVMRPATLDEILVHLETERRKEETV